MQGVAGEGVTILSAKKKLIAIAKDELIMFLKAYEANPCSWTHIIAEMMVNVTGLNQDLQDLYRRYTVKQLKLRFSTKLGKLMATPLEKIADEEVRNQIRKIKKLELRLTHVTVPKTVNKDVDPRETVAVGDNGPTQNAAHNSENEQQPTSSQVDTHRKNLADGMSSNDTDKSSNSPPPKKKRKRAKRSTLGIARENQLLYNKFIRKTMPKVLKDLGVNVDSSDSERS